MKTLETIHISSTVGFKVHTKTKIETVKNLVKKQMVSVVCKRYDWAFLQRINVIFLESITRIAGVWVYLARVVDLYFYKD